MLKGLAFGSKPRRPLCEVSSMALKDTMRRRQASKRGCLAEECYGESPEACIALREKEPLAYLV